MIKKFLNWQLITKASLILIVVLAECIFIRTTWIRTAEQQKEQAVQVALSVKAAMKQDYLQQLSGKAEDVNLPAYREIKERLQLVIRANPQASFAYIYLTRNGKAVIMVDSEPIGSEDESPAGQILEDATPDDFRPFITGEPHITKPVTDRWGTWVSVLVPYNSITPGKVAFVLGMDYDAAEWRQEFWSEMSNTLILAVLSFFLFLALYWSFERNQLLKEQISKLNQAEREIVKLSNAVENSPVSVIITNPEGTIEYVNPVFTQINGFPATEVLGCNPRILKSGITDDSVYQDLWKTISSGGIWKGEMLNRGKSGELHWVNNLISPILNAKKEITHYVAISEDITEKKAKESELIVAKEKAQESDRLKTAFLANLSHEIRTPMNGILGFIEMLNDPDITFENQQEYSAIIESNINRLLTIMTDLIEISKIEAGDTSLRLKNTNLNKLFHELNLSFLPSSIEKNITFNYHCDLDEAESNLVTDKTKLSQIMTYLIKNALKFTDEGSIQIGYLKKTGYLEFYVQDSGIGISDEQKMVLFERFRQAHQGLDRKYEGAGLGLAISKAYVNLLGGTMGLESETGKGSRFYFTIPFNA